MKGNPVSGPAILVVDDSDFDRALLMKALALKGNFATFEANSGESCLEMLATHNIGLILMDIMMPGIAGTEVLTQIRRKANAIELPVIMVTAKTETADIVACLLAGANDYIAKPVNFEVAISRISTHLRLAEISREMATMKEIAALDALIATYNHEINNPLAIAIGTMKAKDLNEPITRERLNSALWRVADIVKRINAVSEKKLADYEDGGGNTKMVKI